MISISAPEIHNPPAKAKTGKNTGGFEFDLEIIEFCPKYANFAQNQGINREFCGFLAKSRSTKHLLLFGARFKEITGNYQGTPGCDDPHFPQPRSDLPRLFTTSTPCLYQLDMAHLLPATPLLLRRTHREALESRSCLHPDSNPTSPTCLQSGVLQVDRGSDSCFALDL